MPDADDRNIAHHASRRKDRQIMTQYYFDTRCHNLPFFRTNRIGATPLVLFLLVVVVVLHPSRFIFDDDHHEEGGRGVLLLAGGVVGVAHAFLYSYTISFPSGNPSFHHYNKRRKTRCDYLSLLRTDDRYSTTTTTSKLFSCTTSSTTSSSTSGSTAAADDATITITNTTATTVSASHQALDLGPPEPLKSLQIGQQLVAFRTKLVNNKDNHSASTTPTISSHSSPSNNFTIERVSYTPDAFLFRNFLTPYECSLIQSTAQDIGMAPAETITHNDTTSRKNCTVAWLSPALSTAATTNVTNTTTNCSRLISNLLSCTANILLSKNILSNPSAGVEDLQVLRYGIGGEFVLHHDGEPRVVTVIYYLNGVGGTWFPLARTSNPATQKEQDAPAVREGWSQSQNDSEEEEEMLRMEKQFYKVRQKQNVPWNKKQALDLKRGYQPGTHGLLVQGMSSQTSFFSNHPGHQQQPNIVNSILTSDHNNHIAWVQQGDALAFYNYHPSTIDHDNDVSLLSSSSSSSTSGKSTHTTSQKLDWRALHCGLPITEQQEGEKWIANHWFRVNDLLLE